MDSFQQLAQKYKQMKDLQSETQDAPTDADIDTPIYEGLVNGQNNPGVMQTGQTAVDPTGTMKQRIPGWINPAGPGATQFLPDQSTSVPMRNPYALAPSVDENANEDTANYEKAMSNVLKGPSEAKDTTSTEKVQEKGHMEEIPGMPGMRQWVADKEEAPAEKTAGEKVGDEAVKQMASKDEEDLKDAKATADSAEKTVSEATKRKFTLNELAAKMEAARQNASVMAGQMQATANAGTITGLHTDTSGYKAQLENDLKEAGDYKTLIEEERNNAKQDMLEKASGIKNQKALMEIDNEKEAHDPDSDISIAARGVLAQLSKELGIKIEDIDGLPYSSVEKLGNGVFAKVIQAKIRSDAVKESAQYRSDMADQKREDKQKVLDTTRLDKANKLITGEVASSRTPFGRSANSYRSAEALEQLVAGSHGNLNNLTAPQITEIARNLDSMLSNGQPTVSGMSKLLPPSVSKDIAGIQSYITNMPVGAGQGAFVQQMMDTVAREKNLASNQMKRTQGKLLASFSDLKDHPVMQNILEQQGLPTDLFEKPEKASNDAMSNLAKVANQPAQPAQPVQNPNEELRQTKDGKRAYYDRNTKQFIRWAE